MDQLDAVEDTVEFELVAAFPSAITEEFFPLVVAEDGELPFERMRAPVVDGRYPDREAPLEVALSERTATRLGLAVGDTLALSSFTQETSDDVEGEAAEPDGPSIDLEVVGIVRDPGDIGARESDITLTFLTPAFRDAYSPAEVGTLSEGTMIVLAEGHSLAEVADEVAADGVEIDQSLSSASAFQQATPTMRSIATALRLFALVAGLAGLIAIGQATTRLQDAAGGDDPTLGALGATRTERWARLAAPSLLAVVGGTVLGLGLGVAASPLFPIGLARRADPDLGFHVDSGTVALGGAVAVALLGALVAGVGLWRVRRVGEGAQRRPGQPMGQGRRRARHTGAGGHRAQPRLGYAGPARPHRGRRHRAQRDGCARRLRVQRERRPPARRTRPVRVGLRRGDRERVLGHGRPHPAARPRDRSRRARSVGALHAAPRHPRRHAHLRDRGHRASRVARSGDGPRRRTSGR